MAEGFDFEIMSQIDTSKHSIDFLQHATATAQKFDKFMMFAKWENGLPTVGFVTSPSTTAEIDQLREFLYKFEGIKLEHKLCAEYRLDEDVCKEYDDVVMVTSWACYV